MGRQTEIVARQVVTGKKGDPIEVELPLPEHKRWHTNTQATLSILESHSPIDAFKQFVRQSGADDGLVREYLAAFESWVAEREAEGFEIEIREC